MLVRNLSQCANRIVSTSRNSLSGSVTSSVSITYQSSNNNNQINNQIGKRSFLTIINQYENGVTFTLGKLTSVKQPGIRLLIPLIQTMEVIDLRTTSVSLEKQEIITRDNISLVVDAVVYYKVIDPEKAVVKVTDHDKLISELAQVKIREILSQNTLDEVLHNREKFGSEIIERVGPVADEWGVAVERINLKDIKFEEGMVRAMAKKAEAERLREAKIISAESEVQTSQQILEAARMLEQSPLAIRIRELDSLQQIAKEQSAKIIFIPTSLFSTGTTTTNTAQIIGETIQSDLLSRK